jgi:hypothetical protein
MNASRYTALGAPGAPVARIERGRGRRVSVEKTIVHGEPHALIAFEQDEDGEKRSRRVVVALRIGEIAAVADALSAIAREDADRAEAMPRRPRRPDGERRPITGPRK